jgi:hypothetical protein
METALPKKEIGLHTSKIDHIRKEQSTMNTAEDERAIRVLNETFAQGMVKKNSKLRASLWLED